MVSRVNLYLKKSSFTVQPAFRIKPNSQKIFDKSVSNSMCEEGFSSVIYFIIINIMLFLFWFMLFLK